MGFLDKREKKPVFFFLLLWRIGESTIAQPPYSVVEFLSGMDQESSKSLWASEAWTWNRGLGFGIVIVGLGLRRIGPIRHRSSKSEVL